MAGGGALQSIRLLWDELGLCNLKLGSVAIVSISVLFVCLFVFKPCYHCWAPLDRICVSGGIGQVLIIWVKEREHVKGFL